MIPLKETHILGYEEVMTEKTWYWQEVVFIPDGVSTSDLLRFQGHIFIKSNIVEELKAKGKFKKKRERKRKRGRSIDNKKEEISFSAPEKNTNSPTVGWFGVWRGQEKQSCLTGIFITVLLLMS